MTPVDSPPSTIALEQFVLRRYQIQDAPALGTAVSESLEHLRPFMAWIALEPTTLEDRLRLFALWDRDWSDGVQYSYGMFREGRVVGGAGLMRRIDAAGLEIGYWVHAQFVGRGFATLAAEVLTTLGLSLSGVSHVEIHHDKANLASGRVPQKLGFEMVGEQIAKPDAPGNTGVNLIWRMDRSRWPTSPTQFLGSP